MSRASKAPKASVVIAAYNRPELLSRLLRQLGDQTLPPSNYEVVVVDDGSNPPIGPALKGLELPCTLTLLVQENAGPAAARHRGALAARGALLVIVDDDMQVGGSFLEEHLKRHSPLSRKVVLGRILPDPQAGKMPLFERWHARMIDRLAEEILAGRQAPQGNHLYTGNVSLPRADYLAVGGFDQSLGHSEDAELGLRLEKAGLTFELAEEAWSLHGSDRASLEQWERRSFEYGVYDHRIGRKHPDLPHANPWRFLLSLNPLSRPLLAASVMAPERTRPVARAAYRVADSLGRMGLERAAIAGATLSFGMAYFRGLRDEAGTLPAALKELAPLLAGRAVPHLDPSALRHFVAAVKADHQAMLRHEEKYGHAAPSRGSFAGDLVHRIGLQVAVAYRVMRLLRESGLPLAAKVVSRLLRFHYGSDIHWDAELEPGVMVVHGMGLAISHAAHVGPGCILFQNVTLGMGIDPVTRKRGAPVLEANVQVGPGATLLGPITVGKGSKVMANAVVTQSIPPGSLVQSPEPRVVERRAPVVASEGGADVVALQVVQET